MKVVRHLTAILCVLAGAVTHADEKPTAVAKLAGDPAMPAYITAEQIKGMPVCKATVEHKETFSARLRTADGKVFTIGSDRGAQQVWHFVATALKEGQTYEFPAAFLAYAGGKYYGTAEAIKAMPACKAALELTGPCYSVFKTADGKWFTIGDPGSKPDVYEFLGSLTDGQTYEFPGAFLEYHKKKP
ncbi:MAG TPA: hypothetical protein VGO11_07600 [Chthoniobacteraceae bacterium]|jgi:hypothetical protein|nr:hypothetical protein [Chthoniobacteraceae bacterium]